MKSAAVIGSNGFIGSVIVKKLLDQNISVFAIYNKDVDRIDPRAKIVTNEQFLSLSVAPDIIFFVIGNYNTPYKGLLDINQMLYRYVKNFPESRLIYVSSANVYGNSTNIITEESPFINPGTYAMSKLSGEFIVQSLNNYSIIRLAYVFGPEMTNNSFIPTLIKSGRNEGKITLFGKGAREQDYIYVDDAVDLCIAAGISSANEIYLGATGKSTSNLEVAQHIKRYMNCDIIFKGEDTAPSYYFDPSETFSKLNWAPSVSIEEGIKNMLT